jgi:hypothetical protein
VADEEGAPEQELPASAGPETSEPPASKRRKGSSKSGKAAKVAKAEVSDVRGPSVAAHPRAARAVARSKAWAGLVGFGLGAYFSLPTGTLAEALARALGAGIVSYVAVWAAAVFAWRRLVILELKAREQQLLSIARARQAPRELPAPSSAGRSVAGGVS